MNNIDLISGFVLIGTVTTIVVLYLYWNWKLKRVYKIPEMVYDELLKKVEKHLYEQECWDFKVTEDVEWGKNVLWVDIEINREFLENGEDFDGQMIYREIREYREAYVKHNFYYDGEEKPCNFNEERFELLVKNY